MVSPLWGWKREDGAIRVWHFIAAMVTELATWNNVLIGETIN
jgi:hypothetical protein